MATAGKEALRLDRDSNPIQALAPAAAVYLTVSGSSSRVALASNSTVVMVGGIEACWLAFGDASITAASKTSPAFLFPGGVLVVAVPTGATHIAGIQADTGGDVSISRLS